MKSIPELIKDLPVDERGYHPRETLARLGAIDDRGCCVECGEKYPGHEEDCPLDI